MIWWNLGVWLKLKKRSWKSTPSNTMTVACFCPFRMDGFPGERQPNLFPSDGRGLNIWLSTSASSRRYCVRKPCFCSICRAVPRPCRRSYTWTLRPLKWEDPSTSPCLPIFVGYIIVLPICRAKRINHDNTCHRYFLVALPNSKGLIRLPECSSLWCVYSYAPASLDLLLNLKGLSENPVMPSLASPMMAVKNQNRSGMSHHCKMVYIQTDLTVMEYMYSYPVYILICMYKYTYMYILRINTYIYLFMYLS